MGSFCNYIHGHEEPEIGWWSEESPQSVTETKGGRYYAKYLQ